MVRVKELFRKHWRSNRPLGLLVVFSLACLVVSIVVLAVDPRLIGGEHAWIKPCKFSISLAVYGLTMMWLSRFLTADQKLFRRITVAALTGSVIELSAIILQVARGTASHFNSATPFDQTVFWIVIAAIMPVSFAIVAIYIMLLRERSLPAVVGAALRWGLFLTIVGLIPGVLMILPDRLQDVIAPYRQFDGHTVGYHQGGPGLPWLGWSTVAGDLRVAHFVGLHAIQVLPVVAYLISRSFPNLSSEGQRSLVWNFGFTYLCFVGLLIWQALAGESAAAPGARTVLAGMTVAAVSVLWTISVLAAERSGVGQERPAPAWSRALFRTRGGGAG